MNKEDVKKEVHKSLKGRGWDIDDINSDLLNDFIDMQYNIIKLNTKKLTKCSNCGKYVEMISTGEFCPNCKC